jgi:hypothetical protein
MEYGSTFRDKSFPESWARIAIELPLGFLVEMLPRRAIGCRVTFPYLPNAKIDDAIAR